MVKCFDIYRDGKRISKMGRSRGGCCPHAHIAAAEPKWVFWRGTKTPRMRRRTPHRAAAPCQVNRSTLALFSLLLYEAPLGSMQREIILPRAKGSFQGRP